MSGNRMPVTAKAALVAEIARAYLPLRRTLRTRGLPAALEFARRPGEHADHVPADADPPTIRVGALRLAAAVDRTLRYLPADSRCLMRALVLCALLARRGVATSLVIGVRDPEEEFIAHAWAELDGEPLQPTAGYARLVAL